jgi:hypothetical protein
VCLQILPAGVGGNDEGIVHRLHQGDAGLVEKQQVGVENVAAVELELAGESRKIVWAMVIPGQRSVCVRVCVCG